MPTESYQHEQRPTKCRSCGRDVAVVRADSDREPRVSRHLRPTEPSGIPAGFCGGSLELLPRVVRQ